MPVAMPGNQSFDNLEPWTGSDKPKIDEPGLYEGRILDVEAGLDNNGFPKLNIKWEVTNPPAYEGAWVWGTKSISTNALNFFRGFCDAIGVFFKGNMFDEQKMIGAYGKLQVGTYTKTDKTPGFRVDNVFPPQIAQNSPRDITLDPALAAHVNVVKAGDPIPSNGPSAPVDGGDVPQDDVPF